MSFVYIAHAVWRTGLYVFYGVLALLVYRFVFSLPEPYPGYIALGVVGTAVVKDLFDHFAPHPFAAKVSYKFVDHNPFNIVLLWGLATGAFVIGQEWVFQAVVVLAVADMLVDGYVDYTYQPSPVIIGIVFGLVAVAIGILETTVGMTTVIDTVSTIIPQLVNGETTVAELVAPENSTIL